MCANGNVDSRYIDSYTSSGFRTMEGFRAESIIEMIAVSVKVTAIKMVKKYKYLRDESFTNHS